MFDMQVCFLISVVVGNSYKLLLLIIHLSGLWTANCQSRINVAEPCQQYSQHPAAEI